MPRVGSSRIRSSGLEKSHLDSTTFCWLPPERFRVLWKMSDDRMRRLLRYSSATCRSRSSSITPPWRCPEGWRARCSADVVVEQEAVVLPILGHVGQSGRDGFRDRRDVHGLAVQERLARDVTAVGLAEDAHGEFGSARAHQAAMPTISPLRTLKDTSLTIWRWVLRWWKAFQPFTSNSTSPILGLRGG